MMIRAWKPCGALGGGKPKARSSNIKKNEEKNKERKPLKFPFANRRD